VLWQDLCGEPDSLPELLSPIPSVAAGKEVQMSDWEILYLASVKLLSIWWPLVVYIVGWCIWETVTDPYGNDARHAKGKSHRV
jgi:hypothetical protein